MALDTKKGARRRLSLFLAYMSAIYFSLPFGRSIVQRVRAGGMLHATAYSLTALLFIFFLLSLLPCIKNASPTRKAATLVLPSLLVFFMFMTLKLPEERLHFFEYGVLGYMGGWVLDAVGHFKHRFKTGLFVLFGLGLLDELIQGILPNRVFDLHDILRSE